MSTVARLLGTLESLGAVVRIGDSGTYGIGAGIRALAGAVDASADARDARAGPCSPSSSRGPGRRRACR